MGWVDGDGVDGINEICDVESFSSDDAQSGRFGSIHKNISHSKVSNVLSIAMVVWSVIAARMR